MTREAFMSALRAADDKFDTEPLSWWAQCIAEHDAEQRVEIEQARKTGDYWKAEHLKGNEEIDRLTAERDEYRSLNEHHKGQFLAVNLELAKLKKWYDMMFGTPCEEIRHAQQVEALEAEIERLKSELNTRRDHVV